MLQAAEEHDRMLSVFHNRRWDCGYLTLKKVLNEGLIGSPLVIESTVVSWRHPDPESWRSQHKHGGGTFRDWGAHLLDQALQLIEDRVVSVYCDMLFTEPGIDVETSARCYLTFAGGVRYIVETGWISPISRPRWQVRGDQGAFEKYGLDPQEEALKKGRVDSSLKQPPEDRAKLRYETEGGMKTEILETKPGNWPVFYQNIADHLLEGAELAVKPQEIYRLMQIYDAADKSVATGQVVECEI